MSKNEHPPDRNENGLEYQKAVFDDAISQLPAYRENRAANRRRSAQLARFYSSLESGELPVEAYALLREDINSGGERWINVLADGVFNRLMRSPTSKFYGEDKHNAAKEVTRRVLWVWFFKSGTKTAENNGFARYVTTVWKNSMKRPELPGEPKPHGLADKTDPIGHDAEDSYTVDPSDDRTIDEVTLVEIWDELCRLRPRLRHRSQRVVTLWLREGETFWSETRAMELDPEFRTRGRWTRAIEDIRKTYIEMKEEDMWIDNKETGS